MTWGAIGAATIATVGGSLLNSGGGGGGGGGKSSPQYVPTGLAGADQTWQSAYDAQYGLAQEAAGYAKPAYLQSFSDQTGLDWGPYLQRANTAGQTYGQTADSSLRQVAQYDYGAQQAQGQQGNLYAAGAQVLDTAMDPRGALYTRTAQQLQDQVRAGQAARGLGNSAAGAGEENQAMENFNIDWQNSQLARQAQGLQADVNANAAGVNQGRLAGADLSAATTAGQTAADYYGMAGSVPFGVQQQRATYPGTAAQQLQGGYANIAQGYGGVTSEAIPYMNFGNGALSTNWQNNYQTNRDQAAMFGQIGSAVGKQFGPQWFGTPGGSSSGVPPNPYYDPNSGSTYTDSTSGYVDPYSYVG